MPLSTDVWSADGELLRVTRLSDDQFRLWVPLEQISPALVDAFLLKEDRWFYWHRRRQSDRADSRAAVRTYRGRARQGGSTLTMQLARLLYRLNTRTPAGKLHQIAAALWLEARYSKRELLEAYLNVVPFGGNIQGVGAASLIYFGKPPIALTLGEALTLAVIPQRPSSRAGRRRAGSRSARAPVAGSDDLWLARHGNSPEDRRQLELPIVARPRFAMPQLAPHFVDSLLADADRSRRPDRHDARRCAAAAARAADPTLSRVSTAIAAFAMPRHCWSTRATWRSKPGLVRRTTGTTSIDGQVNGVLAKRSPGSTLKPFVYALALDQGMLHPQTMLRDAPTSFGPFAPENFDGRFFGPITAEAALIRSRNVPAVWVATQLKQPSLYQFLQSAGVRGLKSGIVLRSGAAARRRRDHHGRTRRALRDAGERRNAAAAAHDSIGTARARRAAGQRGSGVYHARHAAPQSSSRRRRNRSGAYPLAGGLEDRYLVGIPRRLVGRHRRAVRARRVDWRLPGSRQSRFRRRRRRCAAVLSRRGRNQSCPTAKNRFRRKRRRRA